MAMAIATTMARVDSGSRRHIGIQIGHVVTRAATAAASHIHGDMLSMRPFRNAAMKVNGEKTMA